MEQMFIVRPFTKCSCETGKERITDKEHIDKCVEGAKLDYMRETGLPPSMVGCYINRAVFCFDGYLVNGDYLGEL